MHVNVSEHSKYDLVPGKNKKSKICFRPLSTSPRALVPGHRSCQAFEEHSIFIAFFRAKEIEVKKQCLSVFDACSRAQPCAPHLRNGDRNKSSSGNNATIKSQPRNRNP